jgi:ribonucleoside-diphosphate reductase alpha chain
MGVRSEFAFLCDERTRHVSRSTLERVAAVPGVVLPEWLLSVLRDGLHFSPVESVRRPDPREVFDVSVPVTHAFVGNGIVNHNTVNMPEDVTVEDVEQLHMDAWKLGVKAIAIYRDNCKVAQPLATQKAAGKSAGDRASAASDAPVAEVERIVEHVIVQEPVRQKLPRTRNSKTFSFRVADCRGFATVAEYEDGRPGELFLNVSKQGSTLAGLMDSFAIAVSHGLQYGVPLRAFVETFSNRKFEPAGMTDDPDIRIAQSLVDYIFRKMAVMYLSHDERVEIGVLTTQERIQPTLPGVEESIVIDEPTSASLPPEDRAPSDAASQPTLPMAAPAVSPVGPPTVGKPTSAKHEVVLCHVCGDIMQRAGSCHACPSCGATSGCS